MFASHSRNFAVVALIAFVATVLFCTWSVSAMTMDEPMNDCATQQGPIAICSVNPQGHLSAWQNFLNVIPQKTFDLLLLALPLVFVLATYKNVWPRAPEAVRNLVARTYATLEIIDPIKRALARGIIQAKIYPSYIG